MATGGAPGASSSSRKLRPNRGFTFKMSRKFADTRAPTSASGSRRPESDMFSGSFRNAPIALKALDEALISSTRFSVNEPSRLF